MPRQNKGSRMKFLPPKIQLDAKMAATGSYPTVSRLSVDGRTGNYNVAYDDTKTITFNNYGSFKDDVIYYLRAGEVASSNASFVQILPTMVDKNFTGALSTTAANHRIRSLSYLEPISELDEFDTPGNILLYPDVAAYSFITNPAGHDLLRIGPSWLLKPFSASVYMQTNKTNNSNRTIVRLVDTSDIGKWDIRYNPNSSGNQIILFSIYGNTEATSIVATATGPFGDLGEGIWIHVTYDGSGLRSGLNILVTKPNGETYRPTQTVGGATQISSRPNTTSGQLILGKPSAASGVDLDGKIYQFIYLNRMYSLNEFDELAKQGSKSYKRFETVQAKYIPSFLHGAGLPSNSPYIEFGNKEQSATNFVGTGNVVKGIGDQTPMVHFTPGQEGGPFRDNDQYAVDGKSNQSEFYASGTPVDVAGEGFDGPLWSKDKIEIDISPVETTAHFALVETWPLDDAFTGQSTPMVYYNFAQKKWNGIGNGYWYNFNRPQDGQQNHCLGFANGIVNLPYGASLANETIGTYFLFELIKSAGDMTNAYGFPYDARYHASPENTYKLSNVIDRPFLVEKIDITLECDFGFDPNIQNGTRPVTFTTYNLTASFVPAAVNNIFVGVQRKNVKINIQNDEYFGETGFVTQSMLPVQRQIKEGSGQELISTIRDVITFGKVTAVCSNIRDTYDRSFLNLPGDITKVANIKQLLSGSINIETNVPMTNSLNALNWNRRKLRFSLPAITQNKNSVGSGAMSETRNTTIGTPENIWPWGIRQVYNTGGNNNLGVTYPTGRNINNFLNYIKNNGDVEILPQQYSEPAFVMPQTEGSSNKVTPYLLQPSDELIIGWQMPTPSCFDQWQDFTTGAGQAGPDPGTGVLSQVRFFNAPAKLVLYGSYLSEGKPKNDSLNQLLSSEFVHEVIGEE
jgi:hypothetical protein